jgi:hypothetical protein
MKYPEVILTFLLNSTFPGKNPEFRKPCWWYENKLLEEGCYTYCRIVKYV